MALQLLPDPADARPERLSLGDSQLGRTRRGWALFAEKQNCPTWARGKKQGASRRFEEEAEQLPFQLSPDLPRLVERGRGRETRLGHPGAIRVAPLAGPSRRSPWHSPQEASRPE